MWFNASYSFEADSVEEAERLCEAAFFAICEGEGDGGNHICKRDVVNSFKWDDEEDDVRRDLPA